MTAIGAREFERRYREQGDPWDYRTSDYERAKYDATLTACGAGPFESALELGASIGVFSARLAPRCRSLVTIDFSPTAVAWARAELAPYPHAEAILGAIPGALPSGAFDLVVASEVLYYLEPVALAATLTALEGRISRSGRLVCVHWRTPGPERPSDAEDVHRLFRRQPWLSPVSSAATDDYLLDVLERR